MTQCKCNATNENECACGAWSSNLTHLDTILKEMHDRVGAEYKGIPQEDRWYMNHSWLRKEEKDFQKWVVRYLIHNKDAREELMVNPTKNSTILKKFAEMFTFNYGWTYKHNVIST